MFCPMEKCEHYGKATKYPRLCYYEPQCWKGWLDACIVVTGLAIKARIKRMKGGLKR